MLQGIVIPKESVRPGPVAVTRVIGVAAEVDVPVDRVGGRLVFGALVKVDAGFERVGFVNLRDAVRDVVGVVVIGERSSREVDAGRVGNIPLPVLHQVQCIGARIRHLIGQPQLGLVEGIVQRIDVQDVL